MKNYLTIGEVSKIKGVSVKSLRYYGQLGILPPAYINIETGYRYYSVDQLVVVDLIIACLDLEIPLKNFREYILQDGSIDIGRLLDDGKSIVDDKVKKLKYSISFLDAISKHTKRAEKIKTYGKEFVQHIPKRYFLTQDYFGDISDYKTISANYSKLFKQCNELCIGDTFNQGLFFVQQRDEIVSKVFLEIPCFVKDVDNLFVLGENDFICSVVEDTNLSNIMPHEFSEIYILKELYDLKVKPEVGLIEIQKI